MRWLLALACAAWLGAGVLAWVGSAPLGHDEAQYALAATDLLAGRDARWTYVPQGMAWLAAPGVAAGGSELALRALPLVLGLAFVAAAWRLAKVLYGATTAAWVVGMLAASRFHVIQSHQLLSDLPAATLVVVALGLVADELHRDRLRWRVAAVGPLLAASLYVRYGSVVPIGLIAIAWLALGWRGIRARPWPLLAAIASFVALLLPHFVMAVDATGSPLGILLDSGGVSRERGVDPALVPYATMEALRGYGMLVPLLIVGVIAAPASSSLRRHRAKPDSLDPRIARAEHSRRSVGLGCRATWLVWIVAVISILVLGRIATMQPRYVTIGVTLLAIVGVEAARVALGALPSGASRLATYGALAALVVAASVVVARQSTYADRRRESWAPELAAAQAIRADLAARAARGLTTRCVVAANSYTQLEWYTGCAAEGFAGYDPASRGEPTYVVAVRDAAPAPAAATDVTTVLSRPGVVEVRRIDPR